MKNKILLPMLALAVMMVLPNTSAFADEPFIKDFPSMEMSPISEPPTPPEAPKPPETPKPPEEVLAALKQPEQSGKRPPIKIEMLPPKQEENKDEATSKNSEDVQTNINTDDITQQGKLKEIPQTGAYMA